MADTAAPTPIREAAAEEGRADANGRMGRSRKGVRSPSGGVRAGEKGAAADEDGWGRDAGVAAVAGAVGNAGGAQSFSATTNAAPHSTAMGLNGRLMPGAG
jgi:hypothetical protein